MFKKCKKILILLFCATILVTGCSSKKESKEKIKETIQKEISLGSWNENTYENDFLGLTYNKPEDWTRQSDEQIKELMQLGSDLVDASDIAKELAELTSVTYMMTSNQLGSNVILMSEKTIIEMDVNTYIDTLKKQLEAQENLNYVLSESKEETINGKTFVTLNATIDTLKQKYYAYKIDKYIISIIVTAPISEDINSFIEQFEFN